MCCGLTHVWTRTRDEMRTLTEEETRQVFEKLAKLLSFVVEIVDKVTAY